MLKMVVTVTEHLMVRALLDYLRYQSEMLHEHAVRLSPLGCDRAFNEVIPKLRKVSTIVRAQDSEKEQWSSFRLS